MTTIIQLLRSDEASKRPVAADLLDGQPAVNTNAIEPGLFFRLTDDNLVKIGPVAISSDGAAPNSSPVGSSGNSVGETWLDARPAYGGQFVLKVFNGASWVPGNGFRVDDSTGDFELDNVLTVEALVGDGLQDNSHVTIPRDSTANRPSTPVNGMLRYNTSDNVFEGYQNGGWVRFANIGGDANFDDLTATGDIILGNNCTSNTLTVTAVTSVNCNMTIGADTSQTLTVNSRISSSLVPSADSTQDLGSSTLRWANLYTGDLHLANDRGDWTMIEEETYLSLRNNKTGKTFRLLMEEV